ncbi:MAG: cytochrome c oxidase subunit II [Rhodospirillaceae bacterium]
MALSAQSVPTGLSWPAGFQSALSPHGPGAAQIADLSWTLFVGGAVVFLFVIACLIVAMRGRAQLRARLSTRSAIIVCGIAFPAIVLTGLLLYTVLAAASIKSNAGEARLRIEITGEQWWWRVHYLRSDGSVDFVLANEVRVPVGVPVELLLKSADVIHSFWVPSLAGKVDMIPGRVNRLHMTAERAGVFRGQCAEYCGGPHARMALFVIAEEVHRYDSWAERQRTEAAQPDDGMAQRGRALFLERCGVCHAVRGSAADGQRGPDLTHIAGRVSIGAGTLPNNEGTLAAWIADSHAAKPGNLMPRLDIYSGSELLALAAYLMSLE